MFKIRKPKAMPSFFTSNLSSPKMKPKGASLMAQKRWKAMSPKERKFNRMLLADRDGDRVPDRFDCQPRNPKRQESKDFDEMELQEKAWNEWKDAEDEYQRTGLPRRPHKIRN